MEYTLQTILKKPVLVHAYKRTRFGKVEFVREHRRRLPRR
nr:MAG TPA: hypothetical protein [Caudoviricetes sp.]